MSIVLLSQFIRLARIETHAFSGSIQGQRNEVQMKSLASQKNMPKFNAYRLAFGMIKDALEKGCPLQAIAIEESVLTDRLSSTLNVGRPNRRAKSSLGCALGEWHPKKSNASRNAALFDDYMEMLFPKLDAWWKNRNALLHGIAKSAQGGTPEIDAADFMAYAMKTAKEGLMLVRKVDAWTKRQISAARKSTTLKRR